MSASLFEDDYQDMIAEQRRRLDEAAKPTPDVSKEAILAWARRQIAEGLSEEIAVGTSPFNEGWDACVRALLGQVFGLRVSAETQTVITLIPIASKGTN